MSVDAIASQLSVDPSAIEMCRSRILKTLGARTINEALRIAFAAGYGRDV